MSSCYRAAYCCTCRYCNDVSGGRRDAESRPNRQGRSEVMSSGQAIVWVDRVQSGVPVVPNGERTGLVSLRAGRRRKAGMLV